MRWIFAWSLMAGLAWADGERSGDFDYYVLSLSWSPTWCATEGDRRGAPQCRDKAGFGWVLHGLWPQYEDGWPAYCPTDMRNPSRQDTARLAGLYGSAGSAWHQWNKHGRCSGLSADDYYALSRKAYEAVVRPPIFRKLTAPIRLPAAVVEEAFLETNPDLAPRQITITCKAGRIQEARICLTRSLEFRDCAPDVARDCTMRDAVFDPVR